MTAIDLGALPGISEKKVDFDAATRVSSFKALRRCIAIDCVDPTVKWNCYPYPYHRPPPLLLKPSALLGAGSSSSSTEHLVNIINTLSIGNLFHTLFLSLLPFSFPPPNLNHPVMNTVWGNTVQREKRKGEWAGITRAACRILKIHYLKLTWFNKHEEDTRVLNISALLWKKKKIT